MTKRFLDRVFELRACQQLFLPSGTSGGSWGSAIPHTRLRVNQGYPWLPIAAAVKPNREKAIRWHAGCHNAGARGRRRRTQRAIFTVRTGRGCLTILLVSGNKVLTSGGSQQMQIFKCPEALESTKLGLPYSSHCSPRSRLSMPGENRHS